MYSGVAPDAASAVLLFGLMAMLFSMCGEIQSLRGRCHLIEAKFQELSCAKSEHGSRNLQWFLGPVLDMQQQMLKASGNLTAAQVSTKELQGELHNLCSTTDRVL